MSLGIAFIRVVFSGPGLARAVMNFLRPAGAGLAWGISEAFFCWGVVCWVDLAVEGFVVLLEALAFAPELVEVATCSLTGGSTGTCFL